MENETAGCRECGEINRHLQTCDFNNGGVDGERTDVLDHQRVRVNETADSVLKPCPWCPGGGDVWLPAPHHPVRCSKCGAEGPRGKSDEESKRLWNTRVGSPLNPEGETAAFHRGVDAAKEAIRTECVPRDDEGNYYRATCINAIARKCGFDRANYSADKEDSKTSSEDAQPSLGVATERERQLPRLEAAHRPQLVHNARQMFLTRIAKYNDPRNLEWDWDDINDKWTRHAYSAFMDLQTAEAEITALRARVAELEGELRTAKAWPIK